MGRPCSQPCQLSSWTETLLRSVSSPRLSARRWRRCATVAHHSRVGVELPALPELRGLFAWAIPIARPYAIGLELIGSARSPAAFLQIGAAGTVLLMPLAMLIAPGLNIDVDDRETTGGHAARIACRRPCDQGIGAGPRQAVSIGRQASVGCRDACHARLHCHRLFRRLRRGDQAIAAQLLFAVSVKAGAQRGCGFR